MSSSTYAHARARTQTTPASIRDSQNFLKDTRLVAALLQDSTIGPDDLVIEIGPGKGIITTRLAMCCRQVIAVEKDPHLAARLKIQFSRQPNVRIVAGDFLENPLPFQPYKVFANIPFNITSAIIQKLTTAANPPEDAYLILQKEAAQMYTGQPAESLRTICIKPWFEPEITHCFQRTDFKPIPQVDAAQLRLRKRACPLVSNARRRCYLDFIVYGFTTWKPSPGRLFDDLFSYTRRKQVRRELGIDLQATPTSLSLEQWLRLFAYFIAMEDPLALQRVSGSQRRLKLQQQKLRKDHRTRVLSR